MTLWDLMCGLWTGLVNISLARGEMGHLSSRARDGGQPGDEAGGDGGSGELGRESDGQGEQALGSAMLQQGWMTNW